MVVYRIYMIYWMSGIGMISMALMVIYPKYYFKQYFNNPTNLILRNVSVSMASQQSSVTNSNDNNTTDQNSDNNNNNNSMMRQITSDWCRLVSTYHGYIALMNHLATEFSIENLLFVQEVFVYIV